MCLGGMSESSGVLLRIYDGSWFTVNSNILLGLILNINNSNFTSTFQNHRPDRHHHALQPGFLRGFVPSVTFWKTLFLLLTVMLDGRQRTQEGRQRQKDFHSTIGCKRAFAFTSKQRQSGQDSLLHKRNWWDKKTDSTVNQGTLTHRKLRVLKERKETTKKRNYTKTPELPASSPV